MLPALRAAAGFREGRASWLRRNRKATAAPSARGVASRRASSAGAEAVGGGGPAGPPADSVRRVRIALGVVLAALLIRLLFGHDPWHGGIVARLAEGKDVRPKDYWATYGWWAALACAPFAAALLATARRWVPGRAPVSRGLAPPPGPSTWVVVAVAVAVVAGGWLALPRLSQSLWQDEDKTARSYVAGAYLPTEDGELHFWSRHWGDAVRYDRWGPNNFIGFSVAAKASTGLWRWLSGARDLRVDEVAFRLPAWIFGLASIAATAWLLWRLGFPEAAPVAAWLLALHPWHLRYASAARGYSLVLCLVTLGMGLLVLALHRGTWARWCAYGLAQLVLLWTYPAALYPTLLLNVAAVGVLWELHGRGPAARSQWLRFGLANFAGGLVWLLLMAGNLAMFAGYLERKPPRSLGAKWIREDLSLLATGTPWSHGTRGVDPIYPELVDVAAHSPILVWGLALVGAALVVVGAWRLARRGPLGRWLLLPLVASAPLGWTVSAVRHDFLYARNLIYALPALVVLVSVGLTSMLRGRARAGGRVLAALAALPALAFLVAFAWVSQPARGALRERPVAPYRDSVLLTRGSVDPFAASQQVITASFSAEPFYYDPWVERIGKPEELEALMRRADAEGRPLYVNLGRLELARARKPGLMALVESERFEELAVLPAFEPIFTRHVYRYRAALAAGAP